MFIYYYLLFIIYYLLFIIYYLFIYLLFKYLYILYVIIKEAILQIYFRFLPNVNKKFLNKSYYLIYLNK